MTRIQNLMTRTMTQKSYGHGRRTDNLSRDRLSVHHPCSPKLIVTNATNTESNDTNDDSQELWARSTDRQPIPVAVGIGCSSITRVPFLFVGQALNSSGSSFLSLDSVFVTLVSVFEPSTFILKRWESLVDNILAEHPSDRAESE
jgi:hypothetical protein